MVGEGRWYHGNCGEKYIICVQAGVTLMATAVLGAQFHSSSTCHIDEILDQTTYAILVIKSLRMINSADKKKKTYIENSRNALRYSFSSEFYGFFS